MPSLFRLKITRLLPRFFSTAQSGKYGSQATVRLVASTLRKVGCGNKMLCNKFPALTKNNLRKFYVPVSGAVSHSLYGLLYVRPDIVPDDWKVSADWLTNCLFLHSAIGVGCYLYNAEHMKGLTAMRKAMFATYGTALFSFGSAFLFGSIRMGTDSNAGRFIMALLASGALMCIGKEYIDHVNQSGAGDRRSA